MSFTREQLYKSPSLRGLFEQVEAEAFARGFAKHILCILDRRGVVLSQADRWRIRACIDPEVLNRWLDAALTAQSIDEVFASDPELTVTLSRLCKSPALWEIFEKIDVEAWARGYATGRAVADAGSILRVLELRNITVTEADRQRILTCADLELLDRWFDAAVDAATSEPVPAHFAL